MTLLCAPRFYGCRSLTPVAFSLSRRLERWLARHTSSKSGTRTRLLQRQQAGVPSWVLYNQGAAAVLVRALPVCVGAAVVAAASTVAPTSGALCPHRLVVKPAPTHTVFYVQRKQVRVWSSCVLWLMP